MELEVASTCHGVFGTPYCLWRSHNSQNSSRRTLLSKPLACILSWRYCLFANVYCVCDHCYSQFKAFKCILHKRLVALRGVDLGILLNYWPGSTCCDNQPSFSGCFFSPKSVLSHVNIRTC